MFTYVGTNVGSVEKTLMICLFIIVTEVSRNMWRTSFASDGFQELGNVARQLDTPMFCGACTRSQFGSCFYLTATCVSCLHLSWG
jgi:hypothetical protein